MIRKWMLVIGLVVTMAHLSTCLKCPEIPLKFKDELCSCGVPLNSGSGGWEKSCFRYSKEFGPIDSDQLYRLTYLINKRLEFDCNYKHEINYT